MTNGKVTSDRITVEARGLAIPQLIQATSAKQYDVIMTAVIAIPPAAARGLELKVLSTALQQSGGGEGAGVWVKSDSAIKTPKELKGKSLGSYALRSTGYTRCGWRSFTNTGSTRRSKAATSNRSRSRPPTCPPRWRPARSMPRTLIHSQAFRALKSGEFRPLPRPARQCRGVRHALHQRAQRIVSGASGAAPGGLQGIQPMFRESVKYALTHRDEVFAAVGQQTICRPNSSIGGSRKSSDVPGTFDDSHARSSTTSFYELSKEIGMIQSYPDIATLVWSMRCAARV